MFAGAMNWQIQLKAIRGTETVEMKTPETTGLEKYVARPGRVMAELDCR
jgi:hypothetical protein